ALDGTAWVPCRPRFFLPVRVLSRLFRRLFLTALSQATARGTLNWQGACQALAAPPAWHRLVATLRQTEWVVYAKPPLAGPQAVLHYLA
ncbi:transposase, partial [Salmonella sp. SAL4447]|uniref:transposase n=1 Tax=Salmonella sp. SAL4447 TaxID=3159902 RepID=UPI003978C028